MLDWETHQRIQKLRRTIAKLCWTCGLMGSTLMAILLYWLVTRYGQ